MNLRYGSKLTMVYIATIAAILMSSAPSIAQDYSNHLWVVGSYGYYDPNHPGSIPTLHQFLTPCVSSGGGAASVLMQTGGPDGCVVAKVLSADEIEKMQSDRKAEIDKTNDAIGSRLNDLGEKVNSLNKRMAVDEAGLPAAVDQYAVAKLLDKINALEARVKALESQNGARR
jgi:hypothetical protein